MTIHEAAERTGLKEPNIRFYEKEGLLCPKRNAGNQYRSYTQDDLEELERIRFFRLLGFSCAEIAQLQRGELALPDALELRQTALKEEAEENRRLLLLCEQLRQAGNYHAVSPEQVEQKLPIPEEKQRLVLSGDQRRFGGAMALSALAALGMAAIACHLLVMGGYARDAGFYAPDYFEWGTWLVLLFSVLLLPAALGAALSGKSGLKWLFYPLVILYLMFSASVCVGLVVCWQWLGFL